MDPRSTLFSFRSRHRGLQGIAEIGSVYDSYWLGAQLLTLLPVAGYHFLSRRTLGYVVRSLLRQ